MPKGSQPRFYLRRTQALELINEVGLQFQGLQFGGVEYHNVARSIIAQAGIPDPERAGEELVDLSMAMGVLSQSETRKLLGGANRGITKLRRLFRENRVKL